MRLLFACEDVAPEPWVAALNDAAPDLDIRLWPDAGPLAKIDLALVWSPPPGLLRRLPGLRAVFSLGAGIEHVLDEQPPGVKLVRMVDPGLTVGMTEFIVMRVLHYHRRMPEYAQLQAAHVWRPLPQMLPEDRAIGILGLGALGGAAARALVALGLQVHGWRRAPTTMDGVTCHAGRDGLRRMLGLCDIVVCVLPLTPETEDILDAEFFAAMRAGAYLINVARGRHLVEADLLAAIESGRLAGATLDVFRSEPLAPDHPFWDHPRITVMPHVAAVTQPKTAARTIAAQIARLTAGEPLQDVVDPTRGY